MPHHLPFDRTAFLDQLIQEINIPMTEEEEKQIRTRLSHRLDDFLLTALFDSLETAQVRQLNAMQEEFPDIPLPVHLLILSQTIPGLQRKVHEFTQMMKKEVLYLAQKIREMDEK